jgi:uncharacterized protein with HEPN domain
MDHGQDEEKTEVEMMGWLEDRRERKFAKLASSSSPVPGKSDKNDQILKHRRENRIRDIRKLLPLIIGIGVGAFISRGLLLSIVSSGSALAILLGASISAFLIIWFITIRTYVPPGITYTQFGHTDPEDINSMIYIGDILLPKELIGNIKQDAPNYEILRPFGVSNYVESFSWDEDTGTVTLRVPKGMQGEAAFFERHKTFHEMEKIIEIQGETINNYETYIKVELPRLAYKQAIEIVDKIAASFFDPVEGEKIGKELKKELESQKKNLVDLTYGQRATGVNPPMTEENENVQQ